jgi:hypothetical protein
MNGNVIESLPLNTTKSLPKLLLIASTQEQLSDASFLATIWEYFSRNSVMVSMAISTPVRERTEYNIIGLLMDSAILP